MGVSIKGRSDEFCLWGVAWSSRQQDYQCEYSGEHHEFYAHLYRSYQHQATQVADQDQCYYNGSYDQDPSVFWCDHAPGLIQVCSARC